MSVLPPRAGTGRASRRSPTYDSLVGAGIEEVVARARHLFRTEQSANAFLHARCKALGGVPAELAAQGRAEWVLAFLRRLEDAAPAERPEDMVPGYRPSG